MTRLFVSLPVNSELCHNEVKERLTSVGAGRALYRCIYTWRVAPLCAQIGCLGTTDLEWCSATHWTLLEVYYAHNFNVDTARITQGTLYRPYKNY